MAEKRSQQMEELLELIYRMAEGGPVAEAGVQPAVERLDETAAGHLTREPVAEVVAAAVAAGLLARYNGHLRLTAAGETAARQVLRRHRLAERLLHDLFALDPATAEQQACEFEHILLPEVTDAVCTLLGHPPVGIHGKPIPAGPCCARQHKVLQPLIESLRDAPVGASCRIAFIASGSTKRLDRLAGLGVVPGSALRLQQKRPAYVVAVGETTLALDEEIAQEIYVRRTG